MDSTTLFNQDKRHMQVTPSKVADFICKNTSLFLAVFLCFSRGWPPPFASHDGIRVPTTPLFLTPTAAAGDHADNPSLAHADDLFLLQNAKDRDRVSSKRPTLFRLREEGFSLQ
ncbi:hypothetical protein KSP39_PZI008154 [Platanthera zijinensis]|uniref:Uncharacterized protein n=1 Tax=Platanthera zijinensis TaxID=2320716 RepID=A0AAP0BMQ6_9ASPA